MSAGNAPESNPLTTAADRAVDKLVKAARRNKWWNIALTVVCVALAYVVWQNYDTNQAVRDGSVNSCLNGNTARATNEKIWDEFLTLLVSNPQTAKTRAAVEKQVASLNLPANVQQGLDTIIAANWTNNPADVKIVQSFEAYIAAHEKSQDCSALYD